MKILFQCKNPISHMIDFNVKFSLESFFFTIDCAALGVGVLRQKAPNGY